MPAWAKPKLLWETMLGSTGSTLTASSTASGYSVDNIYSMLETNMWKAADTTAPCNIGSYDAGAGNTKTADYFVLYGHNIGTLGAIVSLQSSDDGSSWTTRMIERVTADTASLSEARLLVNPGMECWTDGVTTKPNGHELSGTGTAAARDSANKYSGAYCCALTYGSGYGTVYYNCPAYVDYLSRTITYGRWAKCSTANLARIAISDGVGTSYSDYHSGGGAYEFLTVTRTISASATYLRFASRVEIAGTVYFDYGVAREGSTVSATDVSDTLTGVSARYWRLRVYENDNGSAFSAAPYATIAIWGNKTELDYCSTSFDPHAQEAHAAVNLTQGGYVAGIHTAYTERRLSLDIMDADLALYGKVKTWRDTHGVKQLFVAWDTSNNPGDVFLMYPASNLECPLTNGGAYRDIRLSFRGRKA